MRANEVGVAGPKPNTTRIMSLDQITRLSRTIGQANANEPGISFPAAVGLARAEAIVLKRIKADYGMRSTPTDSREIFYGLSKHSANMATRELDDLINTSIWLGYQNFLFITAAGVMLMNEHSEEEVFDIIAQDPLGDDWEGYFLWYQSNVVNDNIKILMIIEYTRFWMQKTYSEEYTRDGIKYGHGWDDSEWEESFNLEDTNEE